MRTYLLVLLFPVVVLGVVGTIIIAVLLLCT